MPLYQIHVVSDPLRQTAMMLRFTKCETFTCTFNPGDDDFINVQVNQSSGLKLTWRSWPWSPELPLSVWKRIWEETNVPHWEHCAGSTLVIMIDKTIEISVMETAEARPDNVASCDIRPLDRRSVSGNCKESRCFLNKNLSLDAHFKVCLCNITKVQHFLSHTKRLLHAFISSRYCNSIFFVTVPRVDFEILLLRNKAVHASSYWNELIT